MSAFTNCPICRGMRRYWSTIVTRPGMRVPSYRPVCDVCDATGRVSSSSAMIECPRQRGARPDVPQRRAA